MAWYIARHHIDEYVTCSGALVMGCVVRRCMQRLQHETRVDLLRYKNTSTMESRMIQTFVKTCGFGACRRQGGHVALS